MCQIGNQLKRRASRFEDFATRRETVNRSDTPLSWQAYQRGRAVPQCVTQDHARGQDHRLKFPDVNSHRTVYKIVTEFSANNPLGWKTPNALETSNCLIDRSKWGNQVIYQAIDLLLFSNCQGEGRSFSFSTSLSDGRAERARVSDWAAAARPHWTESAGLHLTLPREDERRVHMWTPHGQIRMWPGTFGRLSAAPVVRQEPARLRARVGYGHIMPKNGVWHICCLPGRTSRLAHTT